MIEQIKICTVAHRIIYEDKKRQMDIKFQTRLPQSDSGADCNKKTDSFGTRLFHFLLPSSFHSLNPHKELEFQFKIETISKF
jgi:hypothetical protein